METESVKGIGPLLTGPDRYVARSPWGPFSAVGLVLLVLASQMLLLIVAMVGATVAGLSEDQVGGFMDDLTSLGAPAGQAFMIANQALSLGLVWLAAGRGGARRDVLRLNPPRPAWGTAVAAGVLIALAVGAFELVLFLTTGADFREDARWLMEGLQRPTWWLVVIIAVVLAPLWEEVCFRGFLLSALAQTRLGFWPAALLINVGWTGLHWGYSYAGLASVFVAGLALFWLMKRTGSMRAVVVAHGIANVAAVLFAVYLLQGV